MEVINLILSIHIGIGLVWSILSLYGNLSSSKYRWDEHILYFILTTIIWPLLLKSLIREMRSHKRKR